MARHAVRTAERVCGVLITSNGLPSSSSGRKPVMRSSDSPR